MHEEHGVRGQREEATVVLGSATPSMESYHNAQRGRYQLLEMPSGRIADAAGARRICAPKSQRAIRGRRFLQRLKEAIRNRLEQGEQTILPQPARLCYLNAMSRLWLCSRMSRLQLIFDFIIARNSCVVMCVYSAPHHGVAQAKAVAPPRSAFMAWGRRRWRMCCENYFRTPMSHEWTRCAQAQRRLPPHPR